MRRGLSLWFAAAWMVGCGSEGAGECNDESLASCEVRGYDVDCGGGGRGTVACATGDGRCYRFATGCMPSEFRPVDCPTDDLCCSMADGPWPWSDVGTSNPTQVAHDLALIESLSGAGDPWPIDVIVDSGIVVETASVACTEAMASWCSATDHQWLATSSGFATYRLGRADFGGEALVVEVSDGRARAMSAFRFDVAGGGGPGTCDVPTLGQYLPATGTLVLGSEPATSVGRPSGRLELTFRDGSTIVSEFPAG